MAEEIHELKIEVKIDAETGKIEVVNTKLTGLDKTTEKLGKNAKETAKNKEKLAKALKTVGDIAGVNIPIMAGWIGILMTTTKLLRDSISNAEREIERQKQLKLVVEATGQSYEKLSYRINETISALANISRFTKDEVADAFIKTTKLQGDTEAGFKLLKIAMDVSAGTGKNLNEVLSEFSVALASGTRGTRTLAREYGTLIGNAKTGADAIENLGKTFAGATEKQQNLGKTTSNLRQTYDEFTRTIGTLLMPVINNLIKVALWPLTGILTSLNIAIAVVKTGVDNLVLSFKILSDVVRLKFKDIGKHFHEYTENVKKNWTETFDTIDKAGRRVMGEMDKNISSANINMGAKIKQVMDDIELKSEEIAQKQKDKLSDITQQLNDELKSQQEQLNSVVNVVVSNVDKVFSEMLESGQFTQVELNKIFEGILKDFIRMLERMVIEMLARAVIMQLLNIVSGGSASGIGAVLGAFQTGGTVPETGRYILHKGEKVIPQGYNNSVVNNTGNVNINVGINAMDLRQIDRAQIERIVSQLRPYLSKEIKKYG